jgi:two-component system, OmpR family, alkaline phosphatase synthesis response regulator PhoP
MKEKVLIIEDEQTIRSFIRAYLDKEGYHVLEASDGISGLKTARQFKPDLILLDLMLPGMDGIEMLGKIRQESNVYVILLTAKTEETDKVIGLSMGADDYVTKPFSPRELVARIKAAFRRIRSAQDGKDRIILTFKHVRIDTGSRQVWVDDAETALTAVEFDLLQTLAEHRGMVLSREQLLEKVWGYDYHADQRLVNVHIGNLRKKLSKEDLITTVRGAGYRFDDEVV